MANKKFLLGILVMALVFGMVVVGCGDGSSNGDGGTLTITDLPSSFNGKFIGIEGWNYFTEVGAINPTLISSSTVKIPLEILGKRSGVLYVSVGIWNEEFYEDQFAWFEFYEVSFTNGSAKISYNDADEYGTP